MAKKYRVHVNIYSFGIVSSITYQGIPLYNVQGEAQRIFSGGYKYINTRYPQEYINIDPLDNDRFVNIYMATISIKNDV